MSGAKGSYYNPYSTQDHQGYDIKSASSSFYNNGNSDYENYYNDHEDENYYDDDYDPAFPQRAYNN